jgi:hypothetical protein
VPAGNAAQEVVNEPIIEDSHKALSDRVSADLPGDVQPVERHDGVSEVVSGFDTNQVKSLVRDEMSNVVGSLVRDAIHEEMSALMIELSRLTVAGQHGRRDVEVDVISDSERIVSMEPNGFDLDSCLDVRDRCSSGRRSVASRRSSARKPTPFSSLVSDCSDRSDRSDRSIRSSCTGSSSSKQSGSGASLLARLVFGNVERCREEGNSVRRCRERRSVRRYKTS